MYEVFCVFEVVGVYPCLCFFVYLWLCVFVFVSVCVVCLCVFI